MRSKIVTSVAIAGVLLVNGASADGLSHVKRPLVTAAKSVQHKQPSVTTLADGLSHVKRPLINAA
jgi:hypothetical protein